MKHLFYNALISLCFLVLAFNNEARPEVFEDIEDIVNLEICNFIIKRLKENKELKDIKLLAYQEQYNDILVCEILAKTNDVYADTMQSYTIVYNISSGVYNLR